MDDSFAPEGVPSLSPAEVGFIALFEMFGSMTRAGFTERQALIYLAEMGAAINRNKE